MKGTLLLLFSLITGLLLGLSWPGILDGGEASSYGIGLFFAFVPLLLVEQKLASQNKSALSVFAYAYLAFITFNLITTWWIKNADLMGAVMANVCNAFFMSTVFWAFHLTKKYVGQKEGYISLLIYWLGFEYLHLNWELSWTWLNLGNGLADAVNAIQWYEYTGVLGGTAWIMTANLLLFKAVKEVPVSLSWKRDTLWMIVLLLPLLISRMVEPELDKNAEQVEVLVVQPNIDPYKEKFGGLPPADQIDRMTRLAREELSSETDYLIFPETAFPEAYWEHELEYLYGTEQLRKFIASNPKLKIVVGLSTSILYTPGMKLSETANQFRDGSGWYDNYNTAIQLDSSKYIPIHHKSKLVLGVEKLPFIRSIPLMKKLSINLGGTSGGLGTQKAPTVFFSVDSTKAIAPIICYESVYGEYVTEYTKRGANIFSIITNDGWWGDTPGYKQHLAYARLRAIENRRAIARSANTGTSAFINEKGEITNTTNWWEEAHIKASLSLNNKLTFYAKHGDYIGRTAAFLSPLLILLAIVKRLNKTGKRLG